LIESRPYELQDDDTESDGSSQISAIPQSIYVLNAGYADKLLIKCAALTIRMPALRSRTLGHVAGDMFTFRYDVRARTIVCRSDAPYRPSAEAINAWAAVHEAHEVRDLAAKVSIYDRTSGLDL
jgi:hypothetical protein